jgi:hypothetical protein
VRFNLYVTTICWLTGFLFSNAIIGYSEQTPPSKLLNTPDFVLYVPSGHFVGISAPLRSLAEARKSAISDVVRQILRSMGITYDYQYIDIISGNPHNPKRVIHDRLSGLAHGFVTGIEQNIIKSSWGRDSSARYIYFVLIKYPDELIREMRRLSKGAKIIASVISYVDGEIRLKISEVNGVSVVISSADVTIRKSRRFEPFISFCIWKLSKSSSNQFKIAIGPVRVRNSFERITLRIKDSGKNLKDYLLGSKIQCVAVLSGHDELGRAVSTQVTF